MRLRVIKRVKWTVLAATDERGECALAESLSQLDEGTAEARQIQALIARVATNGPPRNEKRSRRLEGAIYIEHAMRIRAEYRAAKLRGDLEILEEDE